jgi:NAD(P)-dependent dehydrogenase (short-subunit alcohol dehydrogenase family)
MAIADYTDTALTDLLDLTGKNAVITGGAKGLGKAIGRRLAEAGAKVWLADLDFDTAEKAAAELPGDAVAVKLDASDREANIDLADRIAAEAGSLDIWVNNAGIYPFSPVEELSAGEWNKVIDLNLNGVFHGAQAAGRVMANQGSGVILNMSSTAGYGTEGGGIAHYTSAKHAVRGLTKSLAFELGPKGVRCIALAPTLIETPGTVAQKEDIAGGMGSDGDPHEAFAEQIPLRRIGKPDDVARVALFAVSDMAAFVNGDTILVDGGLRSR